MCFFFCFLFVQLLSSQSVPLTTALCSRFALPREITLFFLEPRAKVNLSPGNRPGGSGDRSRCPLGVSVQIFGSGGKRKRREEHGGKEQVMIEEGRRWIRWRKQSKEDRQHFPPSAASSLCCHANWTWYPASLYNINVIKWCYGLLGEAEECLIYTKSP